jgi:putative hydrolase of the HAD superfamily
MNYKAVGFDWGGVLNGRPGKFFGQEVAHLLGITHEQYLDAYFKHNKRINRGEITQEELWQSVLSELGQPDKIKQVMALSQSANAEHTNQAVLDLVDALRGHGYKVGLLSNNIPEKAARMRQTGLDRHFDVFHISAETGYVKPEPAAFSHFADELGIPLTELIFIDDSEKSLSSSADCGFTPLLFESSAKLSHDLQALGVGLKL